jgi:hypothetical protein
MKQVIEGKMEGNLEGKGGRGRKCKQLLDDLEDTRRYWKLREEQLGRTVSRTHCGRGYGPVVTQTTK